MATSQADSTDSPTWLIVLTDWVMRVLAVVCIVSGGLRCDDAAKDDRVADQERLDQYAFDPPPPPTARILQFQHWSAAERGEAFLLIAAGALCAKSSLRRPRHFER